MVSVLAVSEPVVSEPVVSVLAVSEPVVSGQVALVPVASVRAKEARSSAATSISDSSRPPAIVPAVCFWAVSAMLRAVRERGESDRCVPACG